MDDRLRESLSVMLDDEADELTVRRVLAQGRDNGQVEAQWLRWQRLRDHMRGQDDRWSGIDVRAAIWDRLDEPAPEQKTTAEEAPEPAAPRRVQGPGLAALAAMFVVALVVGFGAGQQWAVEETGATLAGASGTLESAIGQETALAAGDAVPSVALQNLDEKQWQQLSDYLLQHAQHNGVAAGHGAVGFARVTSVSPGNP